MLAAIGVLAAVAVNIRRRYPSTAPLRVERAVGAGYLLIWAGTFVLLRKSADFDPHTDWPLQLCHWAAVCAALALITRGRVWRSLAYFWGLALCTQALITPSLTEGPALWPFWFFWATHIMTVAVPLYDVLTRGFRPTWQDFTGACVGAAAYVAIVLPINLATGWNYGFVGPSRPELATIVDFLGPWPQRLLPIVAIAAATMALLMLPWVWQRRGVTRTR